MAIDDVAGSECAHDRRIILGINMHIMCNLWCGGGKQPGNTPGAILGYTGTNVALAQALTSARRTS